MNVPSHEGWIDRQIREAIDRGEFDDLPGAGKPLRGLDNRDPDWWVKQMMEREGLSAADALPPVFQLRREHATFPESLVEVATEEDVREILRDYNTRVLAELRRPTFGKASPPLAPRADVEELVAQWRRLRALRAERDPGPVEEGEAAPPSPRRPWWRRMRRH